MFKNTKHQKQLRDQFIDFTHTTSSVADQFLKGSRYDLELAINNFLSSQGSFSVSSGDILAIFNRYKEPNNSEIIGIDGTMRYIEDLGYEPEDGVALALAEFLESPSAGVFNKKSFLLKWQSAHVSSLDEMKNHLKILEQRLTNDIAYLKKVYLFTFGFSLEEGQKKLSTDTAADYWNLLLKPLYGDKIDFWIDFLKREKLETISRDLWNMFFVFMVDFDKDPGLASYDESAAWPSVIDSFVEDFKENKSSNT